MLYAVFRRRHFEEALKYSNKQYTAAIYIPESIQSPAGLFFKKKEDEIIAVANTKATIIGLKVFFILTCLL
jgi:hypothetical protein